MVNALVFPLWARGKERSLERDRNLAPISPQQDYSKWPGAAWGAVTFHVGGMNGKKKGRYHPFILDRREGKKLCNGNERQELSAQNLFTLLT